MTSPEAQAQVSAAAPLLALQAGDSASLGPIEASVARPHPGAEDSHAAAITSVASSVTARRRGRARASDAHAELASHGPHTMMFGDAAPMNRFPPT